MVCSNRSTSYRHLHEGTSNGQVATLLGDAWYPTPPHCDDESEQELVDGKRRSGEEDESDTTGLGMEMARRRPTKA